jgi:DNA helicase-2/ATP-dependent DNA helicase PcrA
MYTSDSGLLKSGDKVNHTIFGDGVVVKVEGNLATIAFRFGVGIKTIAANHKYLTKK